MKILFICTHNRCRSVLGEAITNHIGQGHLQARSAGSQPAGEVHPLSLQFLTERGISTEGLCSQSWDEHEDFAPDVVFTVCDSAAAESCPVWFGNSIKVHWGLPDPSKLEGSEEKMRALFFAVMDVIEARALKLLELGKALLSDEELEAHLKDIEQQIPAPNLAEVTI
ncbi:arsenate reductase ArsC [Saccharophagus degradans]|uniref:Arsenate reductase ArsC n=1 Tax=Saccharophagus degradans TaxID=86304 RepID=A0AAW7X867_9GAMM|nr:arsenate reductase ArsC [Saccharophagus degradans]MBU2987126.1 arsenate reductase ArsC [Saccharophagus degradans]MDO6423827.1 arsenate reductase ArsC [Saccharophagus degradans]MDO6607907.1 arsenate reductase ArsC [Saccharophagus degradans]